MENSHYFLKILGLESYISNDPLPRDVEHFELDPKIKAEEHHKSNDSIKNDICDKQEIISDEVKQITDNVQADDFFSSLELQSSSKISANMISLSFSNKLTGGIVTRSRSFSLSFHEPTKSGGNFVSKLKTKGRPKKRLKKTRREKLCLQRIKTRGKSKKLQCVKKTPADAKEKLFQLTDFKKQTSNKLEGNALEFEKSKDDDECVLFNNLSARRGVEDKIFENKQTLTNEIKRCPLELFSMNSILINDGMAEEKDEVDNLLEVEDYDDSFLQEIDELNYAPPRSYTGGKWKPGSFTVRTSPMLWQNQNWDSFFEEKNQYEDRRNLAETPIDSPSDSLNKYSGTSSSKWKTFPPPSSHTGGKWKPIVPPVTHTGGKWKPITPPATHTGNLKTEWKPDFTHRRKKPDKNLISPTESDHWKYENEREMEPPPTHTGGKWKPSSSHANETWKVDTASKLEFQTSNHLSEKWGPEPDKSSVSRATLDVIANCQSTSGKCLKTSGGTIQYYCSPCNRRLSSKKMYKKHVQSELHFKRVLQENELEFDYRSLKLFRGLFTQVGHRERGSGKRIIKKPDIYKNSEVKDIKREKRVPTLMKMKGRRIMRREIIRCEVCKVKIPSFQLGKHLVSYYHSRRIQLNDPEQQKLILENIHAIVKQAPYQCGMCKFYCNTHTLFKKHWALPVHKEMEQYKSQRFWCAVCSFECETSRSMELHLDSNSHREVILAVNKSLPIIIRHKVILNCNICFREFRFNRELIRHKRIFHKIADNGKNNKINCPVCQYNCKGMKSLQRHVLNSHKGDTKVPYFCCVCNEFFNTAAEAKTHRNSQFHKYQQALRDEGDTNKSLSRSCSYCEEILEDIEKLKSHLSEKHSEFLPKCIKCGMVFALSQEVSQHVKNNECDFGQKKMSSPKLFACQDCPFSTNTKSEFLLHNAVHQKKSKNEKKISCPLCGSLFTQTSLSIHLRTHLKEKNYACSECSEAFVRKDRYVRHLKLKHGPKEILDASNLKEEEENIEKKEEKNPTEDRIDLVLGNTEKEECEKIPVERRQLCGDANCKYVAKDLNDLENHSIFHVGPKLYQCPECPYSAKTNTIIKRHFMIHVDERSFPCHLCSFKARLKSHLKRHMRLHTGAKPYKCPHCPYTCNILENLRKHVLYTKIHPGKKLYECKTCGFSTNVSKDFKMHLFKYHKDECSSAEANEVAGIYNKEEDSKNSTNSVPLKPRTSAAKPSKAYTAALKVKVNSLTQKFSPIAPKPSCDTLTSPVFKNTGNSVEDKRKILKMELEKLKNRIKLPTQKLPKSYPSPADLKTKATFSGDELNDKNTSGMKKSTREGEDLENEVVLVNVMPTVISVAEESPSKAAGTDTSSMEFPSVGILHENALTSEEMSLYLLDYQV